MTSLSVSDTKGETGTADARPAGERYFRHPGDVVRLVLWGSATLLLALFTWQATGTSEGLTGDLAQAAGRVPRAARDLLLGLTQLVALAVPIAVAAVLAAKQRWRRLSVALLAAAGGGLLVTLLDAGLDLGAVDLAGAGDGWLFSNRFPSLAYVGAAGAAATVGKPWLGRSWRRTCDRALVWVVVVMLVAGTAGLPALLLAVAAGAAVGAALLVAVGAPNRRPSPAAVTGALRRAGIDVATISLLRAAGGRSQLYVATHPDGTRSFVKVHSADSRDADRLHRAYRGMTLRASRDDRQTLGLDEKPEHEALLLVLAARSDVSCPELEAVASLDDGSVALVTGWVDARPVRDLAPDGIDDDLLDGLWTEVGKLHGTRVAHRSLHTGNVLTGNVPTDTGRPVIVDLGFAVGSADDRLIATDRAELIVSTADLVGAGRAVAVAARHVDPAGLAAVVPYLQPLALTSSTRHATSKSQLKELRGLVAEASGEEPAPLAQLVRVRPRTLLTVVTLAGAFYLVLPQLASVGDSFQAIRDANWGWFALCLALSGLTYVASAVGLAGAVPHRLPLGPLVESQFASSFVNRVTPANVGGMALNVRFMQKAGVDPAAAVTGMGLNVLAGGVVHVALLLLFLTLAGRSDAAAFEIPSGSKALVIVCAVLAVVGLVAATRKGRRLLRTHVVGFVTRSWRSLAILSRSPAKLATLAGGSLGVTLAYTCALAAACAALHADVTFAEVGAVYLGASFVAAAAPTPGGLGAMEAALVAGFTGVGVEPGVAVAAVLGYRLATYWIPILPGWLCLHLLERHDLI